MPIEATKTYVELERFDVAAGYLNWAIRLLLDHGAPAEALTLAGAAEEVCGKPLGVRSATKEIAQQISFIEGISESDVVSQRLNEVRNWLKHHSPDKPMTLKADIEGEAGAMICRGLVNFGRITANTPVEAERFIAWIRVQRRNL